ncbi:ABC transporter permease [Oceanibium sediminis]|uniref:ABC transporter permease n=1 Tax=Oceanibium sediminis TaxID=2026339 RepID=UPI000DD3DCF2|nr:ABC transporter permease [Oceanibium sediminis]
MTILATLLSHWRRKPFQLLALIAGLAVATALWSGVQALNAQARAAYDDAAAVLGGDRFDTLVAPGGVTLANYAALRRAGWRVSPVIEDRLRLPGGRSLRLLGIDVFTLPPTAPGAGAARTEASLASFLSPPYRLIAHPGTAALLPGDLPPPLVDPTLPEGLLIGDIALVQKLANRPGAIDRLILAESQKPGLAPLEQIVGARLTRHPPAEQPELARLTDSFHLNLTAFGLLSFVVGLFIVHATIGLAFEQRRAMARTLLAIGVSRRALMLTVLAELLVLAAIGAALGMALGYLLAAALLEDVTATLRGLYGAEVPGTLSLSPLWWLAGGAMALFGTLVAALSGLWKLSRMPVLATAQPVAWHGVERRQFRVQTVLAALLALGGLGTALWGQGLVAGFALMGAVLMAAALILPTLLALALRAARRFATGPLSEWFLAEARAQMGGLSLALMALLLALAVNIGVGSMVSSFRLTFLGWLDQRLASDLYLRGEDAAQAAAMESMLQARADVDAVLPVQHVDLAHEGFPYELYGIRDNAMYRDSWPLLNAAPDAWDRVADGSGILLSEQFARRFSLGPGDRFAPAGMVSAEVVGIYPDYGNPTGQAITSEATLNRYWSPERLRFAVRTGAPDDVRAALEASFALGPEQLVDQAALKAFSRQIFERTFTVTLALNVLTFAVAGLALLTSLLTLADMRLPQLAPLWAMGLTRARLARLELARALMLALITAFLAIPLGLLVSWILLAVVNVEAFGWRIPQALFPGQWLSLLALAVLSAGLAAALPALRLRRVAPAVLLRIFSDAR